MYDVNFWTPARLTEFWDMVAGLLKFAAPTLFIAIAIISVGMFISYIIVAFKHGNDEDDDDYEIKHYD